LYDRATGRVAITGEVKLPDARDGDSPYNEAVIQDAAQKADDAGVQYFFTWNVNAFALWDREKWNVPLLERRVREWRLGRHLRNSEEVARSENLEFIRLKFLPELLRDLGRIYRGQQPDWAMAPDDIFIRSLETHVACPSMRLARYYPNAPHHRGPLTRNFRNAGMDDSAGSGLRP
jgi:hypothetical protein